MLTKHKKKFFSILPILILISSCMPGFLAKPTATPLPPTATPTPVPRTLTICLGQEPDSLYLYGTISPASQRVMDVLYFGGLKQQGDQFTSMLLERIPSMDAGDVILEAVDVKSGDVVVDADGNLATLKAGLAVFPHGCTSAECVQIWDGASPLQLDRMKINFTIKQNLKWSDGQPLTAQDSVFSFNIAADVNTPVIKDDVDLTGSYTAVDEDTIQWVGKPGYLTMQFDKVFWLPLPRHRLNSLDADQLLKTEEVTQKPLGWGPYLVQTWAAGQSIHMAKNPNYLKSNEGFPRFDFLDFVFLKEKEDPIEALRSGKCDVVDSTAVSFERFASVVESQKSGEIKAIVQPGDSLQLLALGIKPVAYDDSYFPFGTDRPAIFDDVRTRQAIAACINRQGMIEKFLYGLSSVPVGVSGKDAITEIDSLTAQPYDLVKADELLTAAGWLDYDKSPATPRVSVNVKNVPNGRNLSVNLLSADSAFQKQLAEEIASSLVQCGFSVIQNQLSPDDLYKPAPEGLVFGRKFDLALLSLGVDDKSACQLLDGREIPTQLNFWLGKTSGGMNFMGYSNPEMDAACLAAGRAGMNAGQDGAIQKKIIGLVNQDLPVIPLFNQPGVVLFRKDLCGIGSAAEKLSFINLDQWEIDSRCQP